MWKIFAYACLSSSIALLTLAPAAMAQRQVPDPRAMTGGGIPGIQLLVGPRAELNFMPGVNYPTDKNDRKVGMLLGLYIGTSGVEVVPNVLISEGQYRGFILDAGLRVTPKWFGQDEYLFNLIAPYAVLGGSVGYPWSAGWNLKAGLGIALLQFGSLNAEIGYRSHTLDATTKLDGVTVGLRYTYPF